MVSRKHIVSTIKIRNTNYVNDQMEEELEIKMGPSIYYMAVVI